MKIVKLDINYLSPPPAIKYCKKCGKKAEHICSELFRVNAQRKYLDIWLIYKCSDCDSTWNMTIYSRVNPKSISPEILDGFHNNNGELVRKYAMDTVLIRRNGAEVGLPKYEILGPAIDFTIPVELHIKSPYPSQLKVSALLREILNLSKDALEQMMVSETIRSTGGLDLKKSKMQTEVIVNIDN
ncbi:DUF1062 domain-containing protein [Pseudobacteroides cellulosolvens]|uniref:DUF1062 domain-containing protein n=1 Tax=Pseudobacteroides cellulosolvens ATCC 35603 = DSM 2933 TaxID=398512 RepID=A0A0L6JSG2_9FIRM|nr:DUF1062 domain-containing protein [Pseudobacteroides cellulosolvens]KNY28728.1 protein of unknown function DUF1062 [Pseudobacteroides cellulosolvens ATCC 35603 = DSM 2933]